MAISPLTRSLPLEPQYQKYDQDQNGELSSGELKAMSQSDLSSYFTRGGSQGLKSKLFEASAKRLDQLGSNYQMGLLTVASFYQSEWGKKYLKRLAQHDPESSARLLINAIETRTIQDFQGFAQVLTELNDKQKKALYEKMAEVHPSYAVAFRIALAAEGPQEAFLNMIDRSDIVVMGETHLIREEVLSARMMDAAYQKGVRFLFIELDSKYQTALDHFIESQGQDPTPFFLADWECLGQELSEQDEASCIKDKRFNILSHITELKPLILAAHQAGIKVKAIDGSARYNLKQSEKLEADTSPNRAAHFHQKNKNRDEFLTLMVNHYLKEERNSAGSIPKSIVHTGAWHARKAKKAAPDFSSLSQNLIHLGYKVSNLAFESYSHLTSPLFAGFSEAQIAARFQFAAPLPNIQFLPKSFAVPTKAFSDLTFLEDSGSKSYAEVWDYVFVLNPVDSQSPLAK